MRDGVGGAGLNAVAAENAPGIVDVINLGVAIGVGDAIVGSVFGGFDIYALRGAGGGAKEAGDALFEAVFVPLQHMNAAIARLEMNRFGGVVLRSRLLEHGLEGDAEALIEHDEGAAEFFNDRCHRFLL